MPCADDRELPVALVARRAAELDREVEDAVLSRASAPGFTKPHYVIGTEGRCVDACPVNIDITEVIQQVYQHAR